MQSYSAIFEAAVDGMPSVVSKYRNLSFDIQGRSTRCGFIPCLLACCDCGVVLLLVILLSLLLKILLSLFLKTMFVDIVVNDVDIAINVVDDDVFVVSGAIAVDDVVVVVIVADVVC